MMSCDTTIVLDNTHYSVDYATIVGIPHDNPLLTVVDKR